MGKLSTILSSVALLAAALYPSDAGAQTKLRTAYTIGDILGESTDWTNYTSYYYNTDGKLTRLAKIHKDTGDGSLVLSNYYYYTYDENGNLVEVIETKAVPTSNENADHEYTFTNSNRTVYVYDEKGQLIEEYVNQWRMDSKTREYYWTTNKTQRYVYTYNEDGTRAQYQQWGNMTTPDKAPNNTMTYTYGDQGSNPIAAENRGAFASNQYKTEFSYDAQGRLVHSVTTWSEDGSYPGMIKEETEYTYDGDFTVEVETTKYAYKKSNDEIIPNGATASKTVNKKVDGDPNHTISQGYSATASDEETGEWIWKKAATATEYHNQSYAAAATYVPTISTTKASEESTDVDVKFTLPAIPTEAFVVKIFRDGYAIATLDQTALEAAADGSQYVFTDKGLINGEHEYFAQVVTDTDSESNFNHIDGYISNISNIEITKNYPAVTDLTCKGYTLTKSWTKPSYDEDEEVYVEGHWSFTYKLQIEWTPLTEEQVEGLGFERYDVYVKGMAGIIPLKQITDITTSSLNADWQENYSEIWISAKYGENRIESEHLKIDLATTPNITPVTPVPVYGVEYYGGYTPAFVKADLSTPAAATEKLYDLWDDSNEEFSCIKGGVTVGNRYYALFESEIEDGLFFGAFDMTNKAYVTIGKALSTELNDLAYDEATETLYGVVPGRRSTLYTVDLATGATTEAEVAVPAYTYYIASDGAGGLFALALVDGKFNFYTIDLKEGTYTQDTDIVVAGSVNKWSSLVYDTTASTKILYFTNNKTVTTINPSNKAVWQEPTSLKRGLAGVVFTMSSELPEVQQPMAENRVLVKHNTLSGSTEYFYGSNGKLARVAESTEEGVVKYTKNSFNEAGDVTTTEVYAPATDAYGVTTVELAATTTNTYNADGKLAKTTNADGTWVSYTYNTYGNIETETQGNGETTTRTLTYVYENDDDALPMAINAGDDIAFFEYDAKGNKTAELHTADPMSGAYTSAEQWEYFPGTDIVSAHLIFDCSGDYPVPARTIKYMMIDNDPMHIMAQALDADENPIDGTAEELIYVDLTKEKAQLAAMQLYTEKDTESVNGVKVKFSVPMLLYYAENASVNIYRDGNQIANLGIMELSALMSPDMDEQLIIYTDKLVANGEHEYFAQAVDDTTGLQISDIDSIELDTELPAVTDVAYVSTETKYTDAEGNITEETTGTPVSVVTIGWNNPEYPADYGFISNNTFIDGETPVAGSVVTDPAATEATVNFGTAEQASVMVQTRYNLGVANSTAVLIDLKQSGVSEVTTDDGLTISIVNKVVTVSAAADIRVFDAAGKLVAEAQGTTLDLAHLNGTYLVAVNYNGAVKVLKAAL